MKQILSNSYIKKVADGWSRGVDVDPVQYPNRDDEGLEGPIPLMSGKIVYYDPKEGKYYDPKVDMFLTNDEYEAHNRPRNVGSGF